MFSRFRRSSVTKAPAGADVESRPATRPWEVLAIEISPQELATVESLLQAAWLASRPPFGSEGPVPAMMRELNLRSGAAAALAHRQGRQPRGTVLLEEEIGEVEKAVRFLNQRVGRAEYREEFLAILHERLGYARAVRYLDSLPIIADSTSTSQQTSAPARMTAGPPPISRRTVVSGTDAPDSDITQDHNRGEHEACMGIHRRYDLEHVDCDGRLI
ncbi:MAG TPA: hypothetical protein VFG15_03345 [Amycolatopsis sp.]|nr:hypothetical protein [Amycolatopsis sp.]